MAMASTGTSRTTWIWRATDLFLIAWVIRSSLHQLHKKRCSWMSSSAQFATNTLSSQASNVTSATAPFAKAATKN